MKKIKKLLFVFILLIFSRENILAKNLDEIELNNYTNSDTKYFVTIYEKNNKPYSEMLASTNNDIKSYNFEITK